MEVLSGILRIFPHPMRIHRRALTLILLPVAIVASTAALYGYLALRLPDPRTADREGLLRWIVTRDLSRERPEIRRILACRIDEEFGSGVDGPSLRARLTPEQRQQVWRNAVALLEPWYADKVDRYFAIDPQERPAYIDRTVDTIQNWRQLAALSADHSAPSGGGGASKELLTILLEKVQACKQEVSVQRRQQIDHFTAALETRWLLRSLMGSIPSGS